MEKNCGGTKGGHNRFLAGQLVLRLTPRREFTKLLKVVKGKKYCGSTSPNRLETYF